MMDGYRGWTNFETWTVNQRLTSEAASASHWSAVASAINNRHCLLVETDECTFDAVRSVVLEAEAKARDELAACLREDAMANIEIAPGVYRDLLTQALERVNWHEIARHMLEDA
jgi:hypothetical protein